MDEGAGAPVKASLSQLLNSARHALASLLDLGRTRLELLSVELQLDLRRLAGLLLLAVVAVLAAVVALVMAGITLIIVYWDSHRVLAAGLVTAGFIAIAAIAGLVLAWRLRRQAHPLEGTLSELARDIDKLRGQR
ncbi:MAG: phage holin family protein [Gammaproteobacteria bacterium]|nr:phage holin family protein [Gammaproteobacteria bacterium]